MTALPYSSRPLHPPVVEIIRGPSLIELFDSNRLVELDLRKRFTFEVTDPSGNLEFSFHLANDYWNPRTEEMLEGRILSCEPLDDKGRRWRVKVRFLVHFSERDEVSFHSFSDYVVTCINYDSTTRKGTVEDNRFFQKFMRWLEPADENNPGGLFFNGRRVARIAEPKEAWEDARNLPFGELKVGARTFNVFGQMFQHGTVGDVADFLDRHTEEEICQHPGMGLGRLAEMKQELRRLGWEPEK